MFLSSKKMNGPYEPTVLRFMLSIHTSVNPPPSIIDFPRSLAFCSNEINENREVGSVVEL